MSKKLVMGLMMIVFHLFKTKGKSKYPLGMGELGPTLLYIYVTVATRYILTCSVT